MRQCNALWTHQETVKGQEAAILLVAGSDSAGMLQSVPAVCVQLRCLYAIPTARYTLQAS